MSCPCKGCDDRKVGCHGSCASYALYKTQMEIIKAERVRDQTCKDLPTACKKAWWKRLKQGA